MDRVLGMDGGGTKTEVAVVARSGAVEMRFRTGGLDPTKGAGWEQVLAEISGKVGPVSQAVLGLPYHGEVPAISARQATVAAAIFGPESHVLNDVEVAFDGALGGGDGVLILAGTGSMAWARGPLGTCRVGGWGDVFGDEGSAYWIGREALSRISAALDGRREDRGFAGAMLTRMGIGAADLIGWTYAPEAPRARIAALATLVSELARAGDADATGLMAHASEELAVLGLTARRLSGAGGGWSYAGGVMADPALREHLAARMGSASLEPMLTPVGGAVLRAASRAGWATDAAFLHRLKAGLENENNAP